MKLYKCISPELFQEHEFLLLYKGFIRLENYVNIKKLICLSLYKVILQWKKGILQYLNMCFGL